jgi:nicotinate-nucleotide adenylyltransferase
MADDLVLFGGTFDPVHHGHLIVARALAEQRGFARITFVPAARPPHKAAATASPADRLEMLRLAIAGEALFDTCDLELYRTGPSYTIDTLRELRRQHGPATRVRWVIGADMLEDLPKWRSARDVLDEAGLVVIARPPWDQRLDEVFASLSGHISPQQIQSLRDSLAPTPLIEISSTEIRHRVAAGQSIRYLVPEAVARYIEDRKLYRKGGSRSRGR